MNCSPNWIEWTVLIISLMSFILIILRLVGVIKTSSVIDMAAANIQSGIAAGVDSVRAAASCGPCVGGTCCHNGFGTTQCCAGVPNAVCCESCPDLGCCPDGWVCDCDKKQCLNIPNNTTMPMAALRPSGLKGQHPVVVPVPVDPTQPHPWGGNYNGPSESSCLIL